MINRDFLCGRRAYNPFSKEIKRTKKQLVGPSEAQCKYSDFLLNTHIFLFFGIFYTIFTPQIKYFSIFAKQRKSKE